MNNEIRDTAMLFVTLILVAIFLQFVAYLFDIRGSFAEARNSDIYAQNVMSHHREFNKYIGNDIIYGGDVIASVRQYYNSELTIAVKNGNSLVYEINADKARDEPRLVEIQYLMDRFPMTNEYKAVLVYSDIPISSVTASYKPDKSDGSYVYAIVFFTK